jgi:hypothetical protein
MQRIMSLERSLELLAWLVATVSLGGVLYTFIIGRHSVIPTGILCIAVLFGNIARFAGAGHAWARHVLFWIFAIAACHTFFALFWAAKPRAILGEAFVFVYGTAFAALVVLSWQYARRNALFRQAR